MKAIALIYQATLHSYPATIYLVSELQRQFKLFTIQIENIQFRCVHPVYIGGIETAAYFSKLKSLRALGTQMYSYTITHFENF